MIGVVKAFAVVVLALWTGACCGPIEGLYPPKDASDSVDVYVYNNHWHTGFVLETSRLSPELERLLRQFSSYPFVEIGWGDDGYYRAPEGTSGLAMRAMFFSRGSVLHVVGVETEPATHYTQYAVDLYRLRISREGHERLMRYLAATFHVGTSGEPIDLQRGLYRFSRFYRARGPYSALHTCNHWVADGVRTTGFPITPFWAADADNVGWQLRAFGRKYDRQILVLRQ